MVEFPADAASQQPPISCEAFGVVLTGTHKKTQQGKNKQVHPRQQDGLEPKWLLLWAFPPDTSPARLNGTKLNSRSSLILWAKCFAVSARSNQSWARYASLMQADLYRVSSSFFRIGLRLPSNTSLSCSFSRGVLTALVFVLHPDSLMKSAACLKSGSISRYCPVSLTNSNSEHTSQQQKAFHD